jgi:hypothetical protein
MDLKFLQFCGQQARLWASGRPARSGQGTVAAPGVRRHRFLGAVETSPRPFIGRRSCRPVARLDVTRQKRPGNFTLPGRHFNRILLRQTVGRFDHHQKRRRNLT